MSRRRQFFKAFPLVQVRAGDLYDAEVLIAPGSTKVRAVVVPTERWRVDSVSLEEHCLGALLVLCARVEALETSTLQGGVIFEADPKDAATSPEPFAAVPERKRP